MATKITYWSRFGNLEAQFITKDQYFDNINTNCSPFNRELSKVELEYYDEKEDEL